MLRYYDTENRRNPRGQSRRSAQAFTLGSDIDGILYITDRDGYPNVFNLDRDDVKLNLNANDAKPSNRWNADNEFVFFRSRKSLLFSPVFMVGEFCFLEYLFCFIEFMRIMIRASLVRASLRNSFGTFHHE